MGINDFNLGVVGGSHLNRDGTSRQDEIDRCLMGEEIHLVREPTNEYDAAAVAVYSCRWVQVGYLSRERCGWIGSKIDRGYKVRACVERVNYRDIPGALLKLVILINMDGEEPEPGPRPPININVPVRRVA